METIHSSAFRRVFERDSILAELEAIVRLESPSHDKAALDILGAHLVTRLARLGGAVERVANACGGDHVLARFPGVAGPRPALVLGHFDTVWPRGTIDRLPFRVEDGRAYGPGIFDMKASLALFMEAIKRLQESHTPLPRPIWVLFTSDEEMGSPTSRGLIEKLAVECAYVLVIEPPLANGGLKTARKGVARFQLEIEGKAAHAGVAPLEGRSAVVELAHQILRLQDLQDISAGTTITVGVVKGGTTVNVVPAHASAEIDVRVTSMAEANRITTALRSIAPFGPGIVVNVTGALNRPPMERTPKIAALFSRACEIGHSLGLNLSEGSTGGGSDGNFTAALQIPTLDGLGALGAGAHANHEHILVDSLAERAAFLAALLLELEVENDGAERERGG